MSDPHPARSREKEDRRTFLQKVAEFIHPGPDSRDELIETLADAEDNDIIGAESRVMLEGVIRMADLTARFGSSICCGIKGEPQSPFVTRETGTARDFMWLLMLAPSCILTGLSPTRNAAS